MGRGRSSFLCRNSAISDGARKLLKWIGIGAGLLILAAVIALSVMAGGLRGAYGMVRYALPHMHRGNLRVGDDAPDAPLVALDGSTIFHIRERTADRPLVLVFGSFT